MCGRLESDTKVTVGFRRPKAVTIKLDHTCMRSLLAHRLLNCSSHLLRTLTDLEYTNNSIATYIGK